jgi:hypothetical protein
MDETFRMLGREHEADLEREAQKRRLAALAARAPKRHEPQRPSRRRRHLALFVRPKEA